MRKATIAQLVALAAILAALTLLVDTRQDSADRAGDPCDQPGRVVLDDGRRWTCTTTLVDRQPRWRTGQLDLPTR